MSTLPNRSALALAGVAPIDTQAIPTEPVKVERSAPPPVTSVTTPSVASESPDTPFWRRTPVITAAVMAIMLGAFGIYLETKLQTGLQDAAARAEAAERGATEARAQAQRELGAAQRAAETRLDAARQVAQSAQTLATITAAADLKRFDLAAKDPGVTAQVLFSRSTGVALSASRLPAAPPGHTWQLWLVSPGHATSVGTLTADADRTNAVFEPPATLPRAVIRAMLTLEPAGVRPAHRLGVRPVAAVTGGAARAVTELGLDPAARDTSRRRLRANTSDDSSASTHRAHPTWRGTSLRRSPDSARAPTSAWPSKS